MQQMQDMWPLGWEDLVEKMPTHSVFLLRESHGQRSLEGYRPRGHKESDMTEHMVTLRVELSVINIGVMLYSLQSTFT